MKNFYLLAGIASITFLTGSAQSVKVIPGGEYVGGYMPECISPDGTFIGGSTMALAMFMADWQTDNIFLVTPEEGSEFETYGAEIRSVTNSGIGVGFDDNGAVMVDLLNRTYTLIQESAPVQNLLDPIADAITEDGTLITGAVFNSGWDPIAVYWENGELNYLPVPSDEQLGFRTFGSRALCISNDGKVIVGYVVDSLNTNPMIMWIRQDDGSYVCDPVCSKWYGDDNEFVWFQPKALSPDGTKVGMRLMKHLNEGDEYFGMTFLGIYDLTDGTLQMAIPDGTHNIQPGETCDMFTHGIANDGTIVGWTTTDYMERLAVIISPDTMQPMLLSEAYPKVEALSEYDSMGEHALSGISADGRYICGMGVNIDLGMAIYEGYVFDTENVSMGIETVQGNLKAEDRYYSLDGKRIERPVKGINILRKADGTVSKILK